MPEEDSCLESKALAIKRILKTSCVFITKLLSKVILKKLSDGHLKIYRIVERMIIKTEQCKADISFIKLVNCYNLLIQYK